MTEKRSNGPDRLTYNHSLSIAAGEKFIEAVIKENHEGEGKDGWTQQWTEQARRKNGVGPIEFLASHTEQSEDKLLSLGSRLSAVPIVDCDHVISPNVHHQVVDGLPMTLLSQSEFGAVTLVHCIPFLEKVLDSRLLADIYGAVRINYALAHPSNLLKHIQRQYNSGRARNRLLVRTEDDVTPNLSRPINILHAKELLPADFSKTASREDIIAALGEDRPRNGAPGETEWWALATDHPYLNLASIPSNKDLVEIISPSTQRQYAVVPICEYGGSLTLATKRGFRGAQRQELISELQKHCKINIVITDPGTINQITNANLGSMLSANAVANRITIESAPEEDQGEIVNLEELAEGDEASITKLVQTIMVSAINKRATDIHISAHEGATRVRFRIDGVMVDAPFQLQFQFWKAILSRIKIMSSIDIKFSPVAQDGKFSMKVSAEDYDIRVNTCPTIYGEKAVMRVQKKNASVPTLEGLGFFPHESNLIRSVLDGDHGLLIVCGPTGSGKTTTLSAVMHMIDRKKYNVITAENPVEIRIPDVEQTPIGELMTFNKFVPAALRQDPDYIMIGETRDKETTEEVIRAAITGHIVMTTLHTNSAAGAPSRLIDMDAQPFLITDALKAVVAQRLLRKICPNCARPAKRMPSEEELKLHQIKPHWLEGAEFLLEPVGCKLCNMTGYAGRVAIAEAYFTSPEIRRIILRENADSEKIRAEIEKQGGKTLYQHAIEHAARNTTSLQEALTIKSMDI